MTIHQDIDKLFKKGLDDYSEKPPRFIWGDIEQNIIKGKIKKRRNILFSIAASVIILVSFGTGYVFTNAQNTKTVVDNNEIKTISTTVDDPKNVSIANNSGHKELDANTIKNNDDAPEDRTYSNKDNTPSQGLLKSDADKPLKSKMEKVCSQGTLSPPIFATSNSFMYDSLQNQHIEIVEDTEYLQDTVAILLDE